jgi:uncharacterized surface protein with fasciclin (FAS1) repeats
MTSFQGGTNSAYLSIGSYRLNTQLFENEYEYMSDLPSVFTVQNNNEKKPLYDSVKGFLPNENNDNINFMKKIPDCNSFLNFLVKYDLFDELMIQQEYTLFVPVNDVFVLDEIVKKYGEITNPKDLLKYHMINNAILPIQLLDQIIRYETRLRNQTFTIKNTSIMTHVDELNLFEDNKILKYYKTDNGSLYLINRPLVHDIYNYF